MHSPLRLVSACGVAVCALAITSARPACADDLIPYSNPGNYNATTYSFTAATTGDVTAYFIGGGGAGYSNNMGLLVNGVQSSAGFGLNNHSSAVGDSFDLGMANAGDSLVFILDNTTLGDKAYSDPSLNVPYDTAGVTGHNHIYSASYTATAPLFGAVPAGAYVSFEDERFPDTDYNYDDESFVFTNVATNAPRVPEPGTLSLLAGMIIPGMAGVIRRRRAR